MITQHKQKNRCIFRLITIIVIIAFLSQNIAWTAPALQRETLAPNSEFAKLASRIDLEMAGIGHGFIQWIKASNIHTLTQFESLLRKNPKVREDLYGNYINTIFYPGKIELISPKFTLVFQDNIKYPEAYLYQIPGTNIRMNLYKHAHLTHTPDRLLPGKPDLRIEKTTKGDLVAFTAWVGNKAGTSILGKARPDGYFAVLAINKIENLEAYKGIGLKLLIKIALDTRSNLKGISGQTNPKLAASMAKYFNGATVERLSDTETKFTLDFSANQQLLDDIENRKGPFENKTLEELFFQELVKILLNYKKEPSSPAPTELENRPSGSYNPSNLMLHNDWLEEDNPVKILELYETMLAVGSDKALREEYSGIAFGAGMAGIRTALATLLAKKKTDGPREVVVVQPCYGCTQNLAEEFESLGLIVQYVNETDTEKMKEQLQKRINKNTALVYFETPVNPTVKLVDIEAIVKEVKAKEEEYGQKIYTFIDNTFATSLAQKPLLMDIDVVVQVITKGETGSGNVLGSVIIAKKDLAEEIRRNREIMAESINKHDAETAIRYGIPYLHIRLPKQTENTKRIYDWLCAEMDKEDELVSHVSYPGEGDSKEKAIYRKQMMHQGHMLYFEFETEELAKHFMRLVRYFRMFEDAVSLGQIRTLVENPSGGTHAALSDSAQLAGGIKETGIRLSIGIEEGDDLIRELDAIFKILRLFKSDLSRIPYKKLDKEFMVKNHEGEYLIRKWPNDEITEKVRQLDLFPDGKFMDRGSETARIIKDTTNIDTYQPINLVIHHAWIWALLSGAHRSVIGSANESTNYRWPDAEKCKEDFGSFADLATDGAIKFIPAGIWRIYARLGTQLSATLEIISALLAGEAVNLEFVGTSFPSENGAFWTLLHKRIEYINLRKIIAYLEKGGEDKYGLLQAYRNGGYIGFKGFLNTADMLDPYTSTTLRTRAEETDPSTKKEIVIIAPPDSPLVGLAGTLKEVYRDSGVPIKIITDPSSLKGEDWLSSADLVFIDNLRMPGLDLEELTRQIKAKDNSILIGLTSTPNASYPGMSEADFTLSILYDQDRDRGAVLNYNRAIGDNKTWFDLGFGRKNVSYAPRDKDTILHILHNLPYLAVRTTRMKENAGRINQLLEAQSTIESTEYNESSHLIHFKLKNNDLVPHFVKLLKDARMIDFGKPLHRDQTTIQQSSKYPKEFILSAGIEEVEDVLREMELIFDTLKECEITRIGNKIFTQMPGVGWIGRVLNINWWRDKLMYLGMRGRYPKAELLKKPGPIACKFPGESDLSTYERRDIEEFIGRQKVQILDSKELSSHKIFRKVIEILNEHAPAHHDLIKKALIEGEAVTVNSSDLSYQKYNGRQAYVRVCIVKSDIPNRKLFGRAENRLGVPIYPAFEEEDGRLFLSLNILSALLDVPTVTPEVLTGLIVHELSELLLGKNHLEAILEERPYDKEKIPSRLLWMIDELGRRAIGKDEHCRRVLKQLTMPYKLAGVYFGRIDFGALRKVEELSRLVTQRAQMWLSFANLARRSKKLSGDKLNRNTRDRLLQFIENYSNGAIGQKDIDTFCGAFLTGKAKDFSFSIGDSRYTCNGFGQTNEIVIIGLIHHEKSGLCLWRFSPEKGTFKIYSLKDTVDKSEKERKRFILKTVGKESWSLENVFNIPLAHPSPHKEEGKSVQEPARQKRRVEPEIEAAFNRLGELVKRYGEFLKNRKTKEPLPLTERTNTYGLPEEIQKIEPFSFEVPEGRKRKVASISGNRFTLTIPKDIGGKATIGLYWHEKWGLWICLANTDRSFFAVYRADLCLECWSKEKKWKDIYSSPIAQGKTLPAALKETEMWLTKGIEEEKQREEAKEIINEYAEIPRTNEGLEQLQARINEFKAAIFTVTSERLVEIRPHTKNRLRFRRLGRAGEKYKIRFVLHKRKGLLAVFTSASAKRRTVVYSLQAYLEYDDKTKEVKTFDIYPIAEGKDYREVMRKAMISEKDILGKLNKVLNKCGYGNLNEFIDNLSKGPSLAQINMLKAHLSGLEEILEEAKYLGEESHLYITIRNFIESIRKLSSLAGIWKEQFGVSNGILLLKPGTVIRYDVPEGRSIRFPDIDHTVSGPGTVEFVLPAPLQLKGFSDKNLKLELQFQEGSMRAKKLFYLHIARNFLYIMGPDGERYTLSQLEDENVQKEIIKEISQAGPGGSISECLADLFRHREALKGRAITVKNTIKPSDTLRWRSGNFGETTIRWELNRLAELGFLNRYTYGREHLFYITSQLLTASPEVIERICRLPELLHPSKFPEDAKERQGLKERIAQTYPQEDLLASDALNYYARKKIEFLDRINEGDTIVLFYHEDADGVASCVLETLFLEEYFKGKVNIRYVSLLYSSYSSLQKANVPFDAHIILLDFNYYTFREIAEKSGLSLEGRNKLIIDHHDDRMEPINPGQVGTPERDGWLFVSPKRCLGIQRNFPAGNLVRVLNRAVLRVSQGEDSADYYSKIYAWLSAIAVYGDIGQNENRDLISLVSDQGVDTAGLQGFASRLNMASQAGWSGSSIALENLLKIASSMAGRERVFRGEPVDNLMSRKYRKRTALLEKHAEALKKHVLAKKMSGPLLFYHLTPEDCRIGDREYRLAEIMADVLHRALPDKVIIVANIVYGNEIKLELRARAHGGLDIGNIMAGLYKGGGHKEAGGAEIEIGAEDIGTTLQRIRLDLEREIAERVGPVTSPDTKRNPPKEQVEDMLSSREKLEDYIRSGDILELVPEWKDWAALGENKNYMRYHHLRPEEHLLIAFQRLESSYFQEEIRKAKLTEEDLMNLRRALFLHDFGEILVLRDDPNYNKESYLKHPEKSVELARDILHRLGYSPSEIEKDLMVIKYHSTLKDLAQSGHSQTNLEKFIKSIKNIRNLELLRIMQLIDAASVRHMLGNSLSIGMERRVNEICNMIKAILTTKNGGYDTYLKRLQDYLLGIQCQNTEIDKAFSRLKDVLREKKIKIDEQTLQEAFLAMHRSHLGQLRKDGKTPFVIHCIETALILIEELEVRNPEWIIATLLHDVLEDTRTSAGVLEEVFGKNIISMVRLLSKPDINNYSNKYERDRDYMRRLIYGTDEINNRHILTAVQTIKIADRIHSLRTLDTKVKGFAKKKIDETYEIFIQYFIGETEVHVPIKQILIAELIREGKKRGLLTPAQIEMLKLLSREIIGFKIPDLETVTNPSTFIKGMAEYMAHERPNKPLVFAFDGMSGVGRSTIAEKVKKDLEKAGRKVVIFDANDFLKQRQYRDSILELAMTTPQRYYEQRDELYNFSRFKEEVLDRIAGFRASNEPYIEFKLSNIYDRLSGNLSAEKSYRIDRDTVILIEGIHVLQEEFLPVYDATFLVYAPSGVCRKNVLMRERAKPRKFQQKAQTIKDRFEILDWPSYRKHLIEYWLASGFIIDNTDYRTPVLKRNPFPRYPSKAPWIPEEFVNPEKQLLRNLEHIFSQLKEKDINPEEIVYGTKDLIGILRNLLAVKDIDKLFADNVDIPSPDADLETLDLFLDQIISQGGTKSINIFFRLFSAYLLAETSEPKLPEETTSLCLENSEHLGIFSEILKIVTEKRISSPPIIPSSWEEDTEIPVLLDIDALTKDPSGTLLAITRLGINLLPGQRIHIILSHPSMNKAEVKKIFRPFYKSINLGKRDTKKSILRVSFELNNLHTTRKGFANYLIARFTRQRKIDAQGILLISTEDNYRDIYQSLEEETKFKRRILIQAHPQRAEIKDRIRKLLLQRQSEKYRRRSEFRQDFVKEAEKEIHRLHELISPAEGIMIAEILDNNVNIFSLRDLDLSSVYEYLREISGLELLDAIKECAIGPTATHVALMPKALENLAKGNLDFFKERFVGLNEASQVYLEQMKNIFEELSSDKKIFAAFILAFLLHDYGLLLMRSGVNSHAADGEKLLDSFLAKLDLTDKQKEIIKALVAEHAKFPMMFSGDVSPFNYEYSLQRLEKCGISRETALKMYSLLLFLDTSSATSQWLKKKGWLNDAYVMGMLYFTNEQNFEKFKENYHKRRFLLMAGNYTAAALGEEEIDRLFSLPYEISKDPDIIEYINKIRFNLPEGGRNILKELSSRKEGLDNPNIFKFFYLLANIYRSNKLDPNEIEVTFIAGKNPGSRLNHILDELTLEEIKGISQDAMYPFEIDINSEAIVINLKEERSTRAHRFQKRFMELLAGKLKHTGYRTEDIQRVINKGLARVDNEGRLRWESWALIKMAAEVLSELLNKTITPEEVVLVLTVHEKIHILATRQMTSRIRAQVKKILGKSKYQQLLRYFQNQYGSYVSPGAGRLTPSGELEIIEELIANIYMEKMLGNPLRLLDDRGHIVELSAEAVEIIESELKETSQRIEDLTNDEKQRERQRVINLLGQNNWNIGKVNNRLGIKTGQSFINFFKSLDLEYVLRMKIINLLEENGWKKVQVSRLMGINAVGFRKLYNELEIEPETKNPEEVLRILREHKWNLRQAMAELNIREGSDYLSALEQFGVLAEFKSELEQVLKKEHWNITETARYFGIAEPTINNYLKRLNLERKELTKKQALAILDKHNWNFANAKEELGIKKNRYWERIVELGIKAELKDKLKVRLDETAWHYAKTSKLFGVGTKVIARWVRLLELTTKDLGKKEALAVLKQNEWNLKKSASALGFVAGFYFDRIEELGLKQELKKKLTALLKKHNNNYSAVARVLGINSATVSEWIDKLKIDLTGGLSKKEMMAVLDENDWDLKKARNVLGIKYNDYWGFLEENGLLPNLKKKLKERLEAHKWNIQAVADSFGVGSAPLLKWIGKLGIEKRPISKQEALEILEENEWDLPKAKDALKLKGRITLDGLLEFGIRKELKSKIKERLEESNWNFAKAGKLFSISGATLAKWAEKLEIKRRLLSKRETLKILRTNKWNVGGSRNALGIRRGELRYFYKDLDIEKEFKKELERILELYLWSYKRMVHHFGVGHRYITYWINDLELERKEPFTPEEALELLEKHDWNIGELKDILGIKHTAYLERIEELGIKNQFKKKLKQRLEENRWNYRKTARQFGVNYDTVSKWVRDLEIDKFADITRDEALRIMQENAWNFTKVKVGLQIKYNRFTRRMQELGIEQEFKEVLQRRLDENAWVYGKVSKVFGVSDGTIKNWIKRYKLKPASVLSREEILEILEGSQWRLTQEIMDKLGIHREYFSFFKEHKLLTKLREILTKRLNETGWNMTKTAEMFAVSADAIKGWIKSLKIPRQKGLTKKQALAILEENDWNLKKCKDKLGVKGYYYYERLIGLGLKKELRAKLKERLAETKWNLTEVGRLFGLGNQDIAKWIEKLDIKQINKNDALNILIQNSWNIPQSRPALGINNSVDIIKFFTNIDILTEFKDVLIRRLQEARWNLSEVGRSFGVSGHTLKRWLKELGIGKEEAKKRDKEIFDKLLEEGEIDSLLDLFGLEGTYRVLLRKHGFSPLNLRQLLPKHNRRKNGRNGKKPKFDFKKVRSIYSITNGNLEQEKTLTEEIINSVYPKLVDDYRFLDKILEESKNPLNSPFLRRVYRRVYNYYNSVRKFKVKGIRTKVKGEGFALKFYQRIGIKFILDKKRVILADEPGLGKSIQALGAALCANNGKGAQKVLIICPKSAVEHWREEIRTKTTEATEPIIMNGQSLKKKSTLSQIQEARFVITNYEAIRGEENELRELLKKQGFDFIIVDEAHRMRNESFQTDAVREFSNAKYKVLLTGTPLIGKRIKRLCNLFNWLYPEKEEFRNKQRFAQYYGKSASSLRQLRNDLNGMILRRMKHVVLYDLPHKDIENVYVELDKEQRRLYTREKKRAIKAAKKMLAGIGVKVSEDRLDRLISSRSIQAAIDGSLVQQKVVYRRTDGKEYVYPYGQEEIQLGNKTYTQIYRAQKGITLIDSKGRRTDIYMRRLPQKKRKAVIDGIEYEVSIVKAPAISAKYEKLDELIADMIKRGEKVVIFSNFRHVVEDLRNRYWKYGVSYITGDITRPRARQEEIDSFQNNPHQRIFISTIPAGGEAITLTAANNVVFLDLPLTPQGRNQAIDRVHRIGQAKRVKVYNLLARKTIDEDIEEILENSELISRLALDDDPSIEELDEKLMGQVMSKLKYSRKLIARIRKRMARDKGKQTGKIISELYTKDKQQAVRFNGDGFIAWLNPGDDCGIIIRGFGELINNYQQLSAEARQLFQNFFSKRIQAELAVGLRIKESIVWTLCSELAPEIKIIDYHGEYEIWVELARYIINELAKNSKLTVDELVDDIGDENIVRKTLYFMDRNNLFKVLSLLGVLPHQYYYEGALLHYDPPLTVTPHNGKIYYSDSAIIKEIAPTWHKRPKAPSGLSPEDRFRYRAKTMPVLPADELARLVNESERGNSDARKVLAEIYIGKVIEEADKKMRGLWRKTRHIAGGLDKGDLCNTGYRVLCEAINRYFDDEEGRAKGLEAYLITEIKRGINKYISEICAQIKQEGISLNEGAYGKDSAVTRQDLLTEEPDDILDTYDTIVDILRKHGFTETDIKIVMKYRFNEIEDLARQYNRSIEYIEALIEKSKQILTNALTEDTDPDELVRSALSTADVSSEEIEIFFRCRDGEREKDLAKIYGIPARQVKETVARIKMVMSNLAGDSSSIAQARSHRFQKKFREVLARKMNEAGFSTGDIERVLNNGLARTVGNELQWEKDEIIARAAEALNEILFRSHDHPKYIEPQDVKDVVGFHERIHILLTPEITGKIIDRIKNYFQEGHTMGKGQIKDYPALLKYFQNQYGEYENELEIIEELIANIYMERLLGNPLRLLNAIDEVVELDKELENIIELEFFEKKITSLITITRDLIDLEKEDRQKTAREDVAEALRTYLEAPTQSEPTQTMAWHVLEGIARDDKFKGKVVYSLNTLLDSSLNDGNATPRLQNLIERTKGRVVFYVGNGCLDHPGYNFPEESLVSIYDVAKLAISGELLVFMLKEKHRKQLGIDKLTPGRLIGNQFVVPLEYLASNEKHRDTENDLFLGLEIIRNEGVIRNNLTSVFYLLLEHAIRQWLKSNGKEDTPEEIQKIMGLPPVKQYDLGDIEDSYEYLKELITSA